MRWQEEMMALISSVKKGWWQWVAFGKDSGVVRRMQEPWAPV